MQILTTCPACGKAITVDLRHKEIAVAPDEPKVAAIIQCEHCRNKTDLHIAIYPHGQGVITWI